jgi:hypothetical protein
MRKGYETVDNNTVTDAAEKLFPTEKVICSSRFTVRLPFVEELGERSQFTRYYERLGTLAAAMVDNGSGRIRSLKSSFCAEYEGDILKIEVTLSARIKEHGEMPYTHALRLCDSWLDWKLLSHQTETLQ